MPDEPPYRVLDEIIKSPLDANEYKLLQLCPNGLKVLLISTSCESPANLGAGDLNKETCAYQEVEQFNLKYLNIPPGSKGNESSPPLEKDEDMDTDSRSYRASRALKKKTSSSRCGPRNSKQTDPEDNLVTVNVMIGSGDFHDPKEFQGMAHFVEHCVFLGSEKYPEAEYIETFTDMHDGETNANTNSECTNFMIKIGPSVLEEALDVLIDCISNPILDENALMSEVETMNNEIAKHRLEEDRRYHYMLQSILANPAHPMSNLGGGSRRTLNKTNLVQETRSWKNKNYIAQNMILGIKGGLPMSRLIEIAVKYGARLPCSHCSDLPRMKLVRDFENVIPFPKEKWNHIYYLTPFVEEKWVRLSWVLPAAAGQDHKTKPIQFLKYLFHSKVPGSLDHFLRRNGWLLKIEIWTSDSYYLASRFCTIFQVNLNLTAKGMKKKNDIIKEVFSYIKTIHKSQKGIMERVFNEMKQNNADSFHYTSDSTVSDPLVSYDIKHEYFLTELGMTIFNTSSAKEILISTSLTTTFDENLIQDSLAHLSDPSNINIMIGESKESLTINNAGLDDGEDNSDNPLGINYTTCQLNPDYVRSLQRVVAAHDKYHLPRVNEFISKRNICYPPDPNEKLEHENDLIIEDSERAFIIYSNRECKKGLLPTAEYVVRLESPRADNWAHPTVASILPPIDLWIKCIEYILESKYMFATVSNSLIGYSVEHKNACIEIVLYGPARKLSELMILIVNAIVHFEDEITKEIFDNMVQVQRVAYTQDMMSAETYANDLRLLVLEQKHCLIADKLEFLNEMSMDEFKYFTEDLKAMMFVHVELSGCVTKSEANALAKMVKAMKYRPWRRSFESIIPVRGMKLPQGERCFRVKAVNANDRLHMVINHYQMGQLSDNQKGMMDKFEKRMKSACYQTLRVYEHLGYWVELLWDYYHTVHGLTISVSCSADAFTADFLNERIDEFLKDFFKEIICNKRKFSTSIGKADRKNQETWSWKDAKEFYKSYLTEDGDNFRKLSVQLISRKDPNPKSKPKPGKEIQRKMQKYASRKALVKRKDDEDSESLPYQLSLPNTVKEENGYFLTDVDRFKSSLGAYSRELAESDIESDYDSDE